jgi:hypothetical protein
VIATAVRYGWEFYPPGKTPGTNSATETAIAIGLKTAKVSAEKGGRSEWTHKVFRVEVVREISPRRSVVCEPRLTDEACAGQAEMTSHRAM